MEKVNSYWFYELGRELRHLHALPDEVSAQIALWPLMQARARINSLLKGDPIPLGVSRSNAVAVQGALDAMHATYLVDDGTGETKWEFPKDDLRIPSWQTSMFRHALESFETVFSAEMGETATYFVPRRGIFNTAALVDAAHETFPLDVRSSIPQKTLDDWRAAGRCLAFNLCSASGYHVARAVEGTIEAYYQKFSGKPGTLRSWYDYIEALEKVQTDPKPTPKTIAEIKQMKDDYRNPLMHPRVVLSEADARILFANGEALILAMAGELKDATNLARVTGGVATLLTGPA